MMISSKFALFALLTAAPLLVPPVRSQPGDPTPAARAIVDLLVKEDFAGAVAQFDARMKTGLPEAKLRDVWHALPAQIGQLEAVGPERAERQGGYDVVFVTCNFERAALDVKVVLNESRRVAGLFFVPATQSAPAVAPPKEVAERAVTVGTGEWKLPGTLTAPAAEGRAPLPAVVLVHGSGPGDRDETVGANKPFRDLAWGLAAKGIAVLRYEKRTKQYPVKSMAIAGVTVKDETIDDALAAVDLLRTTDAVDGGRIFVLGHSLGGTLAPRIARADPSVAGLIILAGATRPMEDLMLEQARYMAALDGTVSPDEQAKLDSLTVEIIRVKKFTPADASSPGSLLGIPPSYWLDLRGYNPPAVARELKQRMLILQGGRDYQVTAADFAGWQGALGTSDRATLKLFPTLNHLFVAGEGRSSPAEYQQPGHVATEVVATIAAWVLGPSSPATTRPPAGG